MDGLIFGIFVGVLVVLFGVWFLFIKRRKQASGSAPSTPPSTPPSEPEQPEFPDSA